MVNDLFGIFLDSFCHYFIEGFCMDVYEGDWLKVLLFGCVFSFGMDVTLAS
jgi:hypothetical protein